MGHGQAQTRSLSDALGREEGLDRALPGRLVHAHAGIADVQANIVARRNLDHLIDLDLAMRDLDRQRAPVRHGIACVHRQVEQRHFQLVGVGPCRGKFVGDLDRQRNGRADRGFDQIRHAVDQRAQMDGGRLERLATGEGEQALDKRLGPLRRLQRTVDQSLLARGTRALAHQHVERANDRGQQIVEVMRDASGQAAHRLDLLTLAQCILGGLQLRCRQQALGDIGGLVEGSNDPARAVAKRGIGDLPDGDVAIGATECLNDREMFAAQRPAHQATHRFALIGHEQLMEDVADPRGPNPMLPLVATFPIESVVIVPSC